MTKKQRERFLKLSIECVRVTADKLKQSHVIGRGDMQAIIAAFREIERRERTAEKSGRGDAA